MTDKDIKDGNRLICLFMDLIECQSPYNGAFTTNHTIISNFNRFIHDRMQDESWYIYPEFHESWDWLIPVIDKIYSMNEYFEYKDYMNNIICDGGIDINTKFIQITFSDVVEFIKWYNNKINK